MGKLSGIGRIFYGVSMAALGFLTVDYRDFPYMLIPPKHFWLNGITLVPYLVGVLLIVSGACIVFEKKARPVSLLLGFILLLIFCFYFVPFEFVSSSAYKHFGDWENAEKELALAAGAFTVAGCLSGDARTGYKKGLMGLLEKLVPYGTIVYGLAIICFGTDHFLYAKDAADYIPAWIPHHLFWIYVAGAGLLGSGIAIVFAINRGLFGSLLGGMILTWFLILHIPKVVAASFDDRTGEVTSAFLALAYCGIAFIIAGTGKKAGVADRGRRLTDHS